MHMLRKWLDHVFGAYAWLFFLFLYAPIVMLLIFSFNANPRSMMTWQGFTFDWYLRVFESLHLLSPGHTTIAQGNLHINADPHLLPAVKNSILIAFSAAGISTVLGTFTALGIHRYNFFGKSAYQAFLFLPIMLPDIVFGIALLIFFVTIRFPLGLSSVILAHTLFLMSYVYVVVSARLAGMDESLEEASLDLGANHVTTFIRVTLPQLMPGIIGGFLLSVIISFDDLVISYFTAGVGSTTLPIYIFGAVKRNISPEINVVAVLMISLSILVVAFALRMRGMKKE